MQFWKALQAAILDGLGVRDYQKEFDDETFYLSHYAATNMPKPIPIRIRKVLVEQLGNRWWEVKPEDYLIENDELDFDDLLDDIGNEFGISIPPEDMDRIDATFDAVVRYIAGRIERQTSC